MDACVGRTVGFGRALTSGHLDTHAMFSAEETRGAGGRLDQGPVAAPNPRLLLGRMARWANAAKSLRLQSIRLMRRSLSDAAFACNVAAVQTGFVRRSGRPGCPNNAQWSARTAVSRRTGHPKWGSETGSNIGIQNGDPKWISNSAARFYRNEPSAPTTCWRSDLVFVYSLACSSRIVGTMACRIRSLAPKPALVRSAATPLRAIPAQVAAWAMGPSKRVKAAPQCGANDHLGFI